MDYDPPSAMTRFGMFFLAGGVAMIFAMWGVLKWLDKPRPPVPVKAEATPVARPSPTPTATPSVAKPSPSVVPSPTTSA